MEIKLIKHIQCPRCKANGKDRSGNNLAVYSDHQYCFSCGYYFKEYVRKPTNQQRSVINSVRYVLDESKHKHNSESSKIPSDFVLSLPGVGLKWIKKYGITDKELVENRIGWSDSGFMTRGPGNQLIQYSPCMVFPIFDPYGNLLMFQARYFGLEKNYPKYITKGKPNEVIHVIGKTGRRIILVEDIISSIKVGRVVRAVPLFGSGAGISFYHRLSLETDSIAIWLDPDKQKEANHLAKRLSCIFTTVSVINSTCDPKECDDEEIKEKTRG